MFFGADGSWKTGKPWQKTENFNWHTQIDSSLGGRRSTTKIQIELLGPIFQKHNRIQMLKFCGLNHLVQLNNKNCTQAIINLGIPLGIQNHK
jgi:hypothetical protein